MYGRKWNCFVGRDIGYNLNHDSKNYIFFEKGKTRIVLFKTK